MKTHSKCADTSNPCTMTFRKLSPILAAKIAGLLLLFLLGSGLIAILGSFFTHKMGMGGNMIWADDGSLLLTTTAFAAASIIGYTLVAAGAVSLSWAKLSFRSERSIGFGVPYLRVLHFAGCLVVASLGLQWLISPLNIELSPLDTRTFDAMAHDGFAVFIIVVVGPFVEELFFRAGMFRLLHKKIGVIQAMVISSLLFGIVHGNWAQGIPAFVIGMALALLYFRSDDLRLCFPAHAANNALGVLGFHFPELENFGANWPPAIQVLLGLLLLVLGFAGLMMRGSLFSKQRNNE